MKRSIIIALIFLFPCGALLTAVAGQPDYSDVDRAKTDWLGEIIGEIGTVKPGMTRLDLMKVFTTEGGLSNRTHRRFVHRRSFYIKVDVAFKPVGNETDWLDERDSDVILSISKPFLKYGIENWVTPPNTFLFKGYPPEQCFSACDFTGILPASIAFRVF